MVGLIGEEREGLTKRIDLLLGWWIGVEIEVGYECRQKCRVQWRTEFFL